MRIYNTLTRKVEEFVPLNPPKVGMYACGPTVYWNQHIGHMYAYVQWDVLARALRLQGYNVTWVMNITDVGHMTSDEDVGEDKMEKGAKREGISVWDLADKYIDQFKESMSLLGIAPDILCRATEHIPEQIALIAKIEKNGFTYKTAKGVVFDTAKFPGYADFSKLDLERQSAREKEDPEKKRPWDFYLWGFDPKHVMQWDSPWGRGFPGWHIECTAMSTKYLGEQFDIHTGGIEHIPVHHTNEIAQGFGAFGHRTANYWIHNGWLVGKGGEKMSKSLGNYVTMQDLVAKGYDPLAMRYLILNSHYRKGLEFSFEALDNAQNALNRLKRRISDLGESGKIGCAKYEEDFASAINDDLSLPQALAAVWKLVDDTSMPTEARKASILRMDKVLGLRLDEKIVEKEMSKEVKDLLKEREKLRKEKKFAEADEIRNKIIKMGYTVEDLPNEVRLNKTNKAIKQ